MKTLVDNIELSIADDDHLGRFIILEISPCGLDTAGALEDDRGKELN